MPKGAHFALEATRLGPFTMLGCDPCQPLSLVGCGCHCRSNQHHAADRQESMLQQVAVWILGLRNVNICASDLLRLLTYSCAWPVDSCSSGPHLSIRVHHSAACCLVMRYTSGAGLCEATSIPSWAANGTSCLHDLTGNSFLHMCLALCLTCSCCGVLALLATWCLCGTALKEHVLQSWLPACLAHVSPCQRMLLLQLVRLHNVIVCCSGAGKSVAAIAVAWSRSCMESGT